MPYELAALSAALCWAIGGLLATTPAKTIGGMSFTRIRMALVFVMLVAASTLLNTWGSINTDQLPIIIASGLVGIFIGDTALFTTLGRLGPRRTSMLFATNAPITAVLSYFWLGEVLSPSSIMGCILVILGVFISIRYGKNAKQVHHFEDIQGTIVAGVAIGLIAAISQSVGSIIIKPVLDTGSDPIAVSAIRSGVATLGLWLLWLLVPNKAFKQKAPLNKKLFLMLLGSGVIGMALGMTILLYAFAHGDVGIAAILSSTTPIMLLPLIWLFTGERPANSAWIGALIAVIGTALIIMD